MSEWRDISTAPKDGQAFLALCTSTTLSDAKGVVCEMIKNVGDQIIVISAPHFTAGICLENEIAVRSAPILRYMIGWDFPKIESYVAKKGWKWEQGIRAC